MKTKDETVMVAPRIPDIASPSREGLSLWFHEMASLGLMFHPEENPQDMVAIGTEKPMFSVSECKKLHSIMGQAFDIFGSEVCDIAYPAFMAAAGAPFQGMHDGHR